MSQLMVFARDFLGTKTIRSSRSKIRWVCQRFSKGICGSSECRRNLALRFKIFCLARTYQIQRTVARMNLLHLLKFKPQPRKYGGTASEYLLETNADALVARFGTWIAERGGGPFGSLKNESKTVDPEEVFDRWMAHTSFSKDAQARGGVSQPIKGDG